MLWVYIRKQPIGSEGVHCALKIHVHCSSLAEKLLKMAINIYNET